MWGGKRRKPCDEIIIIGLPTHMHKDYGEFADLECRKDLNHGGQHIGWFEFPNSDMIYGITEW